MTYLRRSILLVLVCCMVAVSGYCQGVSREYNIKAVFLYNFTQFVDWPAQSLGRPDAPFIIGILGDDPFGNYIDQTVSNEKVKGHPIVVQRYRSVKDIRPCHILYVSASGTGKMEDVSASFPSKYTLTVSDHPNFTSVGGMIRFMTQENKIKLQINPSAAKAADINISSKLLRVAEIVNP